jgi:hypothetical protein
VALNETVARYSMRSSLVLMFLAASGLAFTVCVGALALYSTPTAWGVWIGLVVLGLLFASIAVVLVRGPLPFEVVLSEDGTVAVRGIRRTMTYAPGSLREVVFQRSEMGSSLIELTFADGSKQPVPYTARGRDFVELVCETAPQAIARGFQHKAWQPPLSATE